MIDYIRHHLGAKLFLSYFATIMVGILVLIIASQFILPDSFNRHLAGMGMTDRGMLGAGRQGPGNPGSMSEFFTDYRSGFNEALTYAALSAIIAALVLSAFFSSRVIAPVRAMSLATQHIADGHYEERVQVDGTDELAQLAMRFNQMAEKLDQIESTRRRLIGDVSHELRTPLTAIKGSLEGLMDGVLPANDDTYQQIHAEAGRLNRLVDDLQELSRVEDRAYELDIKPLDIPALVGSLTKQLGPQFASRHISLDLNLAPNLPDVLADNDRAMQVLTNLVGNALQYTPEGGRIIISVQQINHEVQIAVRDTGIGISSEHLTHIFDRFYRVDKSRSRRAGGGSGIGLTIARALVEANGGHIWAESPGDGQGSTFSFTLPVA
jgi:histidine kinase